MSPLFEGFDASLGPVIPAARHYDFLLKFRTFRIMKKTQGTFVSMKKKTPEEFVINSAAFVIRKDIFESINGFDEELYRHEDLDFTQRLIQHPVKIKVTMKAICKVFFEGNKKNYLLREFDQGLEKVRYFEKWELNSWSGSMTLLPHIKQWLDHSGKLFSPNDLDRFSHQVSLFAIMGNVAGVARKLVFPYPGKKVSKKPLCAKIEYL